MLFEVVSSSLDGNRWRINLFSEEDGYRSIVDYPNSYLKDYGDFDYSIISSDKYDIGAERFGMYVDSSGFCDGLFLSDLNRGDIIYDENGNEFEIDWVYDLGIKREITLSPADGDKIIGNRFSLLSDYGYIAEDFSDTFCTGFESRYVLTHGEDYEDSLINEELIFDDKDWKEFLTINKIYGELRDA